MLFLLIEIKVLDVNDYSFIFVGKIENILVFEFVLLGVEFFVIVVEDIDIGNYFVESYEIVKRNDSDIFDLVFLKLIVEIMKFKFVVLKRFDWEINESFFLEIEVRDGGSLCKVGCKGIWIIVLDLNDYILKFS